MKLGYKLGYLVVFSAIALSGAVFASLQDELLGSEENERRLDLSRLPKGEDVASEGSSRSADTTPRSAASTASDDSLVRASHQHKRRDPEHHDMRVEEAVRKAQKRYQQRHPSASYWALADIEARVRSQYAVARQA